MDPLDRFIQAQAPVYAEVLEELRAGRKRTHWMWFIFPQLRVLGRSATALHFGIGSLDEARRYWDHPVLGERLKTCTELVLGHADQRMERVLGDVDALKFRSCLTLFERAAPDAPVFGRALEQCCHGERDPLTLRALAER